MVPENFNFGYACINTILRPQQIFCSRTIRLSTLKVQGVKYAKDLALQNLKDLLEILKWNNDNKIKFMRISSDIFPFATYSTEEEDYSYSLDFAQEILTKIGNYAKENNIRLTMHPAQFNVLNSPDSKVVINCIKDLSHHCDILDRMGLDQNSVMIIHGGGVYNDKKASLKRLEENFKKLPENVQKRIVLENCEMSYTVEELLHISQKLNIPLVIDFHHDDINPGSQKVCNYFKEVYEVWKKRNIKPKVHVSNSVPGILATDSKTKRRKHSDYIYFLHEDLLQIKFPLDVMLECKMKEQSIFRLNSSGEKK